MAFYMLLRTIRTISVGVVYAAWSGVRVLLIGLLGCVIFKQKLDGAAVVDLALIVAGLLVFNLVSKALTQ